MKRISYTAIAALLAAVIITGCGQKADKPAATSQENTGSSGKQEETAASSSGQKEPEKPAEPTDPEKMFTIAWAEDSKPDIAKAVYAQEDDDDAYQKYTITSNITPAYFAIHETEFTDDGALLPDDVIFEKKDMKPGDFVYMTDVIPEGFPSRMIEWKTADGRTYYRAITESGKDGSILLIDLQIPGTDESGKYTGSAPEKPDDDQSTLITKDGYYVSTVTSAANGAGQLPGAAYGYELEDEGFYVEGSVQYGEKEEDLYGDSPAAMTNGRYLFRCDANTTFQCSGGDVDADVMSREEFEEYVGENLAPGLGVIITVKNGVAVTIDIAS